MEETMKERKKAPPKKELRILYTPEHYDRLQKQADLLDMTAAAFVRMVSMEKVTALEAAGSQRGAVSILQAMQEFSERMEDKLEESR